MVSKKYNLEVSEEQVQTISLALDILSRLEGGQLERCFSMIPWKYQENQDEANALLEKLQMLLTGMPNGSLGIGNISDQAKCAFDLHHVIRHHLAWERNPAGGVTVDFHKPLHKAREPLAKISKLNTNKKIKTK